MSDTKSVQDLLHIMERLRDKENGNSFRLLPYKFPRTSKKVKASPFSRMMFPLGKGTSNTQDKIFEAQRISW